jgi:glycerol-3-phosphate dehydrogenase
MKRDIEKLASEMFDVLVIGGGIHGAAIAREASREGFKTALIEKDDFGNSTSFNSMKVIHGGLRYLQHGNFKRIRQSVRSRKIMQEVAPHLIKAVPFLIPTYGFGIKSKNAMRVALSINDLISLDRNFNLETPYHIPGGKLLSKNDILKILPDIDQNKLSGGAVWYEAVVQNTERLLLEFLLDAYNYDFTAANYVEAGDFLIQNSQVKGVLAKNLLNSEEITINAKIVVNAVGPWFNPVQKSLNLKKKPEIKLTKAINIIIQRRIFSQFAVGLEGKQSFSDTDAFIKRSKRFFFFVPIENYTMIGTSYKIYDKDIDEFEINKEDIQEIIDEVNYLYPSAGLTFDDVSFYHVGLLPLDEESSPDNVQPEKHSVIYDYEKENNFKNLFSVKSVKYTTAPVIAEDLVKKLKKKINPSHSFDKKSKKTAKNISENIPQEIAKHLIDTYGSYSKKVFEIIKENESYLNLVSDNPPVTVAEIIHTVRNEMAFTLKDVVLRRTGMGTLKCPSLANITAVASVMSSELGWNKTRETAEIDNLLKVYSQLTKYAGVEC